ncbi:MULTISPECIES: winged helix-turn-helix transcriptional regulator [unclassified Cupriavidus]|uniref:winged helix-turn-helix transcriptional regulator n=1 Tax=Cupriavidus sp. H19C3 TaxID=3241603 RepID=UPI003BF7DCE5
MAPKDFAAMPCPIARSLSVLGERWTLLIMREAFYGSTRFDEFERRLGIAPNILSARLKALVEAGLLARTQAPGGGARHIYALTEPGRDFFPVFVSLKGWADRYRGGANGPLTVLVDAQSGAEIAPPRLLRGDGSEISLGDLRVLPGPGARSGQTRPA